MNLFISYSSKSREAVDQLAADLTDLGYTVWFDRELTGGHQWWGAILGQIRECDVFIFALTPESLDSYPCELEWKYAATLNKRILPVQLVEVRLTAVPMALQEIQMVDYQTRGMTQLAALNKAIVKLPAAQALPDPLPPEPPTPLAPLVVLGEQLDAPTLSADAQLLLIAKLRPFLDDTDTKPDAIALLKRLRRRDDLLARMAEEIGQLLGDGGRRGRSAPAIPTREATATLQHEHVVHCALALTSDEFLTGCANGLVTHWQLQPKYVQTFLVSTPLPVERPHKIHDRPILSIALSPDRTHLGIGCDDGRVGCWGYPEFDERLSMAHRNAVNSITFMSNGTRLLSASDDGKVAVWPIIERSTVSRERVLPHEGKVRSVAGSPIEEYAVTGGTDAIIRLWVVNHGAELRRLQGHSSSVNSVTFSPNGRHILSGSSDWTVRLWDAANGKEIRQFLGHSGRVSSVAFAPDGQHIVSAAADKRAILWDVTSGEEVCHFVGHTDRISSVAFSPDGHYIVTASHDKTARVWETGL